MEFYLLIAYLVNLPWILMGDFNCVLYSYEKDGENPILNFKLSNFRNYIEKTSLSKFANYELFYTWSNLQKDYPIQSK